MVISHTNETNTLDHRTFDWIPWAEIYLMSIREIKEDPKKSFYFPFAVDAVPIFLQPCKTALLFLDIRKKNFSRSIECFKSKIRAVTKERDSINMQDLWVTVINGFNEC